MTSAARVREHRDELHARMVAGVQDASRSTRYQTSSRLRLPFTSSRRTHHRSGRTSLRYVSVPLRTAWQSW
ncbi:hypothetical protein ABT167_13745 [Streptomyces sp. NPDC001792]|uniref:hypothetical protein n=1 Tax=Streptomyces sp. NPDC001792 TaxID=3154524 RepID=UPI00331A437C